MKINAGVNDWYSYIRQSNAMRDPSISALDRSVQVQEDNASRYQDRVTISEEARSLLDQVGGGDPGLADDPSSQAAPKAVYSPASQQSSAASDPQAQAATRDGVAVDASGPPWRVLSAGQPLTAISPAEAEARIDEVTRQRVALYQRAVEAGASDEEIGRQMAAFNAALPDDGKAPADKTEDPAAALRAMTGGAGLAVSQDPDARLRSLGMQLG
ncbi:MULTISPECIES: hypothetical protein [unclassified Pseudomonas]|uniref:hypothetical protein n=1 Tax=unclassified Pseudomonas TaxID=196821 RepID=UPI000DAA61F4|nr:MULTISPECIES: hypothetical protein [unclassified Pseudomonas]MDW3712450.1 hypothetical protein [Pseudomonas sp. 2023EL-01195]PZE11201.1 hypothetical protein DMX10_22250 [Pseudomonas sp. 57B-090624]